MEEKINLLCTNNVTLLDYTQYISNKVEQITANYSGFKYGYNYCVRLVCMRIIQDIESVL